MLSKFVFFFHIFVMEDSGLLSQINSQFVFDDELSCRTVEHLINNKKHPENCLLKKVSTVNNDAVDNLNLLLSSKNS